MLPKPSGCYIVVWKRALESSEALSQNDFGERFKAQKANTKRRLSSNENNSEGDNMYI
jgi:hypothetical protein